jgi:beta-xylosidase
MYSKRLDALARAAIAESVRLDDQEAPQRETERQKKKDEENRVRQEKARQANKAPFRP